MGMACALRYFNADQPNATELGGLLESFVLGELCFTLGNIS